MVIPKNWSEELMCRSRDITGCYFSEEQLERDLFQKLTEISSKIDPELEQKQVIVRDILDQEQRLYDETVRICEEKKNIKKMIRSQVRQLHDKIKETKLECERIENQIIESNQDLLIRLMKSSS